MAKPNPQQVARAGEHFVAAELHRRGAYAVTFAGNMPRIDMLASNASQTRVVQIQVKTSSAGGWQTSTKRGLHREEPSEEETTFWVFVELRKNVAPPEFYIVPEWWIQNDIYESHKEYLDKHGGVRPNAPQSTHHKIDGRRIAAWHDKWELLDIF